MIHAVGIVVYVLVCSLWMQEKSAPAEVDLWPTMVPAILSLVGVVIGAWLLNFLTSRREHHRARFEWSKMLFEKYEKAYRDFLNGWRGVPSATLLEKQFDTLQANSLVPSTIIDAYSKAYSILADSNASDVQKQEACKMLSLALDHFMFQPWSGVVVER